MPIRKGTSSKDSFCLLAGLSLLPKSEFSPAGIHNHVIRTEMSVKCEDRQCSEHQDEEQEREVNDRLGFYVNLVHRVVDSNVVQIPLQINKSQRIKKQGTKSKKKKKAQNNGERPKSNAYDESSAKRPFSGLGNGKFGSR